MTEELKQLADTTDWSDADAVIAFYEPNQEYFAGFASLDDEEEIVEFIKIKLRYVDALIAKSRYKKAKRFITDIDILNQKIKDNPEIYAKYEEKKDFYLGIIYGRLKNYSESVSIFRKLTREDPENDNYEDWYNSMRVKSAERYSIVFSFAGAILVFGTMALDLLFHIYLSNMYMLAGGGIVLISVLFPYVYRFWINTKFVWK